MGLDARALEDAAGGGGEVIGYRLPVAGLMVVFIKLGPHLGISIPSERKT